MPLIPLYHTQTLLSMWDSLWLAAPIILVPLVLYMGTSYRIQYVCACRLAISFMQTQVSLCTIGNTVVIAIVGLG